MTQYDYLDGTSMASPHAAGAAALLASMPGNCFDTPTKIYQALKDTALDLGTAGWDQYYGYGIIQIANAMATCPVITPAPFTVEYDLVSSENCSPLVQYNWRDTSGGTDHILPNERTYVNIALPPAFDFKYGGQSVTSPINGHANGFISMGNINTETTEGNFSFNFPLPAAAKPNNFIAPFWDDLSFPNTTGMLHTKTLGNAPNREFVVEYRDFQQNGVPDNLNFEVVLFETTNEILFQYRTLTGEGADGSSATVGLEYGNVINGFAGYQYSYNRIGALKNGLALLFIPYTSGSPTLPSNAVCPQTQAVTIEVGISTACDGSPTPFDVGIPAGVLPHRSILKIQQLTSAPIMPASFLDLGKYADIHLAYSPPDQPLNPMPQVDVCYAYTPQDVLAAGGHPENLFITAHDESADQWQPLSTAVDALNNRLIARAPHFSYYGVATLKTSANNTSGGLGLPITGSPLSREFIIFLVTLGVILIFLLSGIWRRRKHR